MPPTDLAHKTLTPTKFTYLGLFLVSLATLMFETLLTRIFSVTMWYHFAFFAISMALFGMTTGAIIVYALPHVFRPEHTHRLLAMNALFFSITLTISFLTHLSVPILTDGSLMAAYAVLFNFVMLAIPFIFSGITISLTLTRFTVAELGVSKLYAADLVGAALGCVMLLFVLRFADGPSAVIFSAFLAALGAWLFARNLDASRLKRRYPYGVPWAALVRFSERLYGFQTGSPAAPGVGQGSN